MTEMEFFQGAPGYDWDGVTEECPPWSPVFELLVPSGWRCCRGLEGAALLEEVHWILRVKGSFHF